MSLHLLLIGDSGTGKTGALLPLTKNYNLHIADFENSSVLQLNASAEQKANLHIEKFNDKFATSSLGGRTIANPNAISRFYGWLDKESKTWGKQDIFVLDSLTQFGRCQARHFQLVNKIPITNPIEPRQYGSIQSQITGFMDQLLNDAKDFHYIVISHIDYKDYEQGTYSTVGMMEQGDKPGQTPTSRIETKGVPTVFGAKLGPMIGQYFDFMLRTRIMALGDLKPRRVIQTSPDATIDIKCPILALADKGELPLSSGLQTIFETWENAMQA